MFDVTSFLMRWLYLCNLVRDRAEIQSLPYTPLIQQQHQYQQHHMQHQPPHPPPLSNSPQDPSATQSAETSGTFHHYRDEEEEWRDECLRGILSYPPGTQRLLAMDALRIELIQQLNHQLSKSDNTLQRFAALCQRRKRLLHESEYEGDDDEDPYLETDVEIVRLFGEATKMEEDTMNDLEEQRSEEEATLVISEDGTDVVPPSQKIPESLGEEPMPTQSENDRIEETTGAMAKEAKEAQHMVLQLREYLPQIVSAVLHSPPALTQVQGLDPIRKLRRLILTRCLQDASFGIDLCWLLEAEVGRAWKTLFEHRQQTGKRLIVVLPAERAVALAKIGMEKQGAFHLLQDAEQATAYGYLLPDMDHPAMYDAEPSPPRLPSSLSMRRCSHFGDTMHFIDRLTQISLDLRLVPNLQRETYLAEALAEMNRRLRRRMVTAGDVSLDVEDNRGPYDWPEVSDLTVDMLKYSVHLPLEPLCPFHTGDDESTPEGSDDTLGRAGVMRVLNIVVSECRILASRERCPYLIQLELAETGLDGSDARLYAGGSRDLGTTIEEALGMVSDASAVDEDSNTPYTGFPGCQIPSELMAAPATKERRASAIPVSPRTVIDVDNEAENDAGDAPGSMSISDRNSVRGGWADDEAFYNSGASDYMYTNPYDIVRQQEYEQLHQQMSFQQHRPYLTSGWQQSSAQRPQLTMKAALLDRIFGVPWSEKCKQVRQASPYGNVTGWRMASFITKAGEDIRREALVMQLITKMNEWFQSDIPEHSRPFLRPYRIMCVGGDAGLLECINDAKSVDEVKKLTDGFVSLRDYFERAYGSPTRLPRLSQPMMRNAPPQQRHAPRPPNNIQDGATMGDKTVTFEVAQDNFLRSLVGYSLVSYVLQIKDRHNANILIDREGHLMHIDFGFVLGDTPKMSKVPLFSERAPFKMSAEFWDVLGGWNVNDGGLGVQFCKMFEIAFACAASHVEEIVSLVEGAVLNLTRDPDEARSIANDVRSRLAMRGQPNSVEQKSFVMELVNGALSSWGTSTYDWLQRSMNGYQ